MKCATFSKFDVFNSWQSLTVLLHLTEDKLQSFISVTNIECATVERFYERTFHKNAEPLLLEFQIVRIGFIAKCESDARSSGFVWYRISSEPDSGTARRSFRGFRDLQEGRCLFRYCQHDPETSFN
jgi:hypothetical protein